MMRVVRVELWFLWVVCVGLVLVVAAAAPRPAVVAATVGGITGSGSSVSRWISEGGSWVLGWVVLAVLQRQLAHLGAEVHVSNASQLCSVTIPQLLAPSVCRRWQKQPWSLSLQKAIGLHQRDHASPSRCFPRH